MEELKVFDGKFGQVRVLVIDDKPWFMMVDVCKALGNAASGATYALKRLSTDEYTQHRVMTPGGLQTLNILSASGVIHVLHNSRKLIASEIEKWLRSEVFPALYVKDADCKQDRLQTFTSSEFGRVRTIDIDGEPWFVAADVCEALDIRNPTDTIKKLDDDEKARLNLGLRGGDTNVVNESGLYSLVLGSRKPEAKAFKRWITHEVIPTIRKTGGYIAGQENMTDAELLAKAVLVAQRTIEERTLALQKAHDAISELAPKAEFADAITKDDGLLTVNQIAKSYGMSAITLNKKLYEAGIQYKQGKQWLLYARYADKGYVKMITIMDTTNKARQQMKWTQLGRKFIYDVLKKKGFVPNEMMEGV